MQVTRQGVAAYKMQVRILHVAIETDFGNLSLAIKKSTKAITYNIMINFTIQTQEMAENVIYFHVICVFLYRYNKVYRDVICCPFRTCFYYYMYIYIMFSQQFKYTVNIKLTFITHATAVNLPLVLQVLQRV